jgi:glycosyltransferase involved in cell wall biosynthesis
MEFSIVTPSFNQGRFIERTLRSVSTQQSGPLEHVVVDGGSSDDTVPILRRFDRRVRWTSERDRGQTDAINRGIRTTSGAVIGWLNSDDVYYEGALEVVAAYLRDHPEVDVVYGEADHIGVDDEVLDTYPTEQWNFERLKETCFLCQPAVFFRRRVTERFGLLDERLHYCMDYEYWIRLALAGVRFGYVGKKLAGSRMYGSNKTLGARRAVHGEINDMMARTLGNVPERWLYNYAHVVAGERIDRVAEPRRFAQRVALESVRAAIRWNRWRALGMCARIARRMSRRPGC